MAYASSQLRADVLVHAVRELTANLRRWQASQHVSVTTDLQNSDKQQVIILLAFSEVCRVLRFDATTYAECTLELPFLEIS